MSDQGYSESNSVTRQPPWFLVTGVLIGLLLGLFISLVISPVTYRDTAPGALAAADKDHYRLLIALAYAANPDYQRASQRLALLQDATPLESISAQAQQELTDGNDINARALAKLALAVESQLAATVSPVVSPPSP